MKLDFFEVLQSLFKRANAKVIKEPSHKFFRVFESVRNFMKQKRFWSIASIFLDENYLLSKKGLAE